MADLAVLTKNEAVSKAERYKAALKSVRAQAKQGLRCGSMGLMGLLGGAAAGVLDVKLPTVPGLDSVPSAPAAGVLLILGAATGYLDDQTDHALALGIGLAAPYARDQVVTRLRK